jgi:hypothetical protein
MQAMNKRCSLAILVACFSLAVAEEASAYYAAHMGRFMSRDPNGDIGRFGTETPRDSGMATGFIDRDQFDPMAQYDDGMNLYQYVNSSPLIYVDPLGLLSRKDCEKKLDGMDTHLKELADHFSRGHCGALRKLIDDFLNGGCKKWRGSFEDRLDVMFDTFDARCRPHLQPEACPIPVRQRQPAPFVGPCVGEGICVGIGAGIAAGAGWWVGSGLPILTPWPDPY